MVVVGVIALIVNKHEAEYSSVLEILGLTGMFATLFAASAWMFRSAARRYSNDGLRDNDPGSAS